MAKQQRVSKRFACRHCFRDERLRQWISRQSNLQRGACGWCGTANARLIPLTELGPLFRTVARMYTENRGDNALLAGRGEAIGFLFHEDWNTFSEVIEESGQVETFCAAILQAGLHPKDDVDEPDYDGLFFRDDPSRRGVAEDWEDRVTDLLSHPPAPPTPEEIAEQPDLADIDYMPDRLEYIIEEMGREFMVGETLFRARVHRDRDRSGRFAPNEVGAPPGNRASAGRANREHDAMLYVATDETTAISEVRPWKGAPVAVARIILTRPVRILDLTDFEAITSPFFEEEIGWKVEARSLLWQLREDMKRPVTPHLADRHYQPTQYAADLVRNAGFHGIAYPSAMGPGVNIVIFDPAVGEVSAVSYVRVNDVVYSFEPEESQQIRVDEFPYE
jgi:RES domain-containing protein